MAVALAPVRTPNAAGEIVIRPTFRGAAKTVFKCRDREIVVSGPAGTGKSRGVLEKLHGIAIKYAGARILIARKTLTSLAASGLVTYERQVIHPDEGVNFFGGSAREPASYRYPNGSKIVIGGLDKPAKVLSAEYDIIYVQECTEATLEDWEMLMMRLRSNIVPYQQIVGDCNPDAPTHWIKQREAEGKLTMVYSHHEDNPAYFDDAGNVTQDGIDYIAKLDNLTGVRKKRYRLGLWVAAEGQVYEEWDASVHVIAAADLPKGWSKWPRVWTVDFGYTNPFVWQDWAISPDGDLYRLREIYHSRVLVEDHARDILALTGRRMVVGPDGKPTGRLVATRENPDPLPTEIICDHDAEDRATLERHIGIRTKAAHKSVTPGIQAVTSRLKVDPITQRARLFYVREGLVKRDEERAQAKKTTSTIEEFASYVWDTSANRKKGEEPVKDDDHGMDATRYLVAYVDKIHQSAPGARFRPIVL